MNQVQAFAKLQSLSKSLKFLKSFTSQKEFLQFNTIQHIYKDKEKKIYFLRNWKACNKGESGFLCWVKKDSKQILSFS